MGINLVTGRSSPAESMETNFTLTQNLINLFEKQYGSVNCRQLIGCDMATEEGQCYLIENKLMEQCYLDTASAARIATSLIAE